MERVMVAKGAAEEEKAEKHKNKGERLIFFVNFRLDFLLPLNMKSAPIYKGGRGQSCLCREKIFNP